MTTTIERLEKLNQFISSDLRTYNGAKNNFVGPGLINALNGCFVVPSKRDGVYDHSGLMLIWQAQSFDNASHEVILEGEGLAKYLKLMEAQSEAYR
jgi:hypothetical protein